MPKERVDDVADERNDSPVEPGAGGGDQPADVGAGADSLVGLCRRYGGRLPSGERAYCVQRGVDTRWIFAKSPAQAAMACCEITRVTDKELVKAAFEAMGVKSD